MNLRYKIKDGEPIGLAVRKFKKLIERSGIQREERLRRSYMKPSERRRRDERQRQASMKRTAKRIAEAAKHDR